MVAQAEPLKAPDPTDIGKRKSYIDVIETSIGLPLEPKYAKDIKLSVDDCARLFEDLKTFYEPYPLSTLKAEPSSDFSPVLTGDVSHLKRASTILSELAQSFDTKTIAPSSNRTANLFVFARSTILSDPIAMSAASLGTDIPGRRTDEEIAAGAAEDLRSLCAFTHLVKSDTIIFYFPTAVWSQAYDAMADDLYSGIGLGALDTFREWVLSEVIDDRDLRKFADTFATMAMSEMAESIAFCQLLGRKAGPVLSSQKAIDCYMKLLDAAGANGPLDKSNIIDTANLYSYSSLDMRHLPTRALSDIRFDSKAFALWHQFLAESLHEIRDYNAAGRGFDEKLRGSLERRGVEFERQLKQEFGSGNLSDAFKFDSSNIVGFLSGVSLESAIDSVSFRTLLIGAAAAAAEKVAKYFELKSNEKIRGILKSHYHAFVPLAARR